MGIKALDFFIKNVNILYMKHETELELVKKYPKILRDYRGDPRQTCMAWGICTDEGWHNLLDKCMEKLQYFCDLCSKDGRVVQVIATQQKEKMGSLRFYYIIEGANDIESSIIDDIVSEAENQSENTCEISGEPGSLCVRNGWYKTLCYEEARKNGYSAASSSTEEYWKQKDLKKNDQQNNDT
jgi:hypothetical protein